MRASAVNPLPAMPDSAAGGRFQGSVTVVRAGSPGMGLILDSSILIAGERRTETVMQVIPRVQAVFGQAEAALSSVSIVELTHGIYRAKTDADRERRKVFCDELCRDMIVQPVSLQIAQLAGRIEGEQAAKRIAIAEV